MRRLCRLIGWFVVVDALITMFGVATAPLLLSLAADGVIGWLLIRSCIEIRATLIAAPANRVAPALRGGGQSGADLALGRPESRLQND